MDVQEAKLRQRLEGTGVSVTRMGDNITLNMPSNITFALNSADLNAQFYNALDGVSMVLKEYDKTVIEVAGHTDSSGSDQYNQALSERRAQAVAGYLASHGVKKQRLITIGAGEGASGRVQRHGAGPRRESPRRADDRAGHEAGLIATARRNEKGRLIASRPFAFPVGQASA